MGSIFYISDTLPPASIDEMKAFFANIFHNNNSLIVEIGSGNGHFLVERALKYPDNNYIGTDLLTGRAKKFYSKIEKRGLKNIVVFKGDARRFVWEFLYENTVEEFIILFPDPWPKQRHRKHRLLTAAFINMLKIRLVPGGMVTLATDYHEYRNRILDEFRKDRGFTNIYRNGYSS
ncbi:MAG: tRNA (guanosine(46)-N7)-methyltransferase TrmB, partial [Spirochaetes bacterium]|nr:tRNA (guanosine(46)-N7)-methyltransferase TrmB [Spirochaetota bacterium]